MIKDMLFTEKYRPKLLNEIVGLKVSFDSVQNISNLLLAGRCGIGKTTVAKAIANQFEMDTLYLNASDERGIDIIRFTVKEFASTMSISGKPKLVHFDEADGLTADAQNSLRNIMEEYSNNTRFIFTCNNPGKIIQPLRSRCVEINLSTPDKEDIRKYLVKIIVAEKIHQISEQDVSDIISINYPDIRSMVNALQHVVMFGSIPTSDHMLAKDVLDLVRTKKFTEARKMWIGASPNYRELIIDMMDLMTDGELTKWIIPIAKYDFEMAMGAYPEVSFAACMMVMCNAT
jgi:replication factor C small subunit